TWSRRPDGRAQLAVDPAVGLEGLLDGEPLEGPLAGASAQLAAQAGVGEEPDARLRHAHVVARGHEQARVADGLAHAPDAGRDDGLAARHRLDEREGQALRDAAQGHDRARSVGIGGVRDPALEPGGPVQAEPRDEVHAGRGVAVAGRRRGAEDPQPRLGEALLHVPEGADQRLEVLQRVYPAEPADRGRLGLAGGRREGAHVDAVVDRAYAPRVGAVADLPPLVVVRSRPYRVRLLVDGAREQAEEAEQQRLHDVRAGSVEVAQVALAQVDTVLGQHQGDAVL